VQELQQVPEEEVQAKLEVGDLIGGFRYVLALNYSHGHHS